jgi:hypothetical protein
MELEETAGRYIAHYSEKKKQWSVRIIDENGHFAVPAEGPLPGINYTDCRRIIRRMRSKGIIV